MSIINRMLADLERRGAPSRRDSASDLRPAPRPRRRVRPNARLVLVLIALGATAVAVSLWVQRADRILAAWPPLPWVSQPVPQLVQMSFDSEGDEVRLRLGLSDAPADGPRYSRSGGRATLLVDAARGDLLLPAPPAGQGVFRGVSLEAVDAALTRIHLELDPAVELDLSARGDRIVLVGARPAPAVPDEAIATRPGDAGAVAQAADAVSAESPARAVESAGSDDPEGSTAAEAGGSSLSGAAAADEGEPAPAKEETSTPTGEQVAKPRQPEADSTAPPSAPSGDTVAATTAAQPDGSRAAPTAAVGAVRKTQSMSAEVRARRRYREAREAIDRGELTTARQALQEALDLDPALHAARDLLVGLVRRVGDTAAARRLLAQGVERAPARLEFAMPYARLLVDTGALDRAADVLQAARPAGAGSADYHALLAAIEQRRGQHRAAAAEYTRALELRPRQGVWWLGLGISLAAIERPHEAESAFREARASGTLDPSLDRWARDRIQGLNRQSEG